MTLSPSSWRRNAFSIGLILSMTEARSYISCGRGGKGGWEKNAKNC